VRINLERSERQKAPPLRQESDDLLGLSAYVGANRRGQPIAPPQDETARALRGLPAGFFNKPAGAAQPVLRTLP